jgi:cytochrome c-type biogenesis protein CcmH/NrfF
LEGPSPLGCVVVGQTSVLCLSRRRKRKPRERQRYEKKTALQRRAAD